MDEKLDQKLMPLNFKVSDLSTKLDDAMQCNGMQIIDLANSKYEEVITNLNSHEIERIEIQEESKILKSVLQQTESQLLQLKNSSPCMNNACTLAGRESTNYIVMKIASKLMDIDITKKDISVSHSLPENKGYKGKRLQPAMIVKCVRRDTKAAFYRARSKLKNKTT